MAVVMWVGTLMQLPWLIVFGATIMLINSIVTVRYAPLIMLYRYTVDRVWPSGPSVVDALGMRLAHLVAFIMMTTGLWLALQPSTSEFGWKFLWFVCIFKTVGAIGYCPVSRGFTCLLNGKGDCCKFLRRSRG
jgi:hypothetical protein